MFRILRAWLPLVWLAFCLGLAGCQQTESPAIRSPNVRAAPSIIAQAPRDVRLRPAAEAILPDSVVGMPRRAGNDHLTEAEAVSEQPDQAAAQSEFSGWDWLDGATRIWSAADETLVLTARDTGAIRAFRFWARDAGQTPFASGGCSPVAAAGLDDCLVGIASNRAIVVGRLGPAVFRISCPTGVAERLTAAQAAALLPAAS